MNKIRTRNDYIRLGREARSHGLTLVECIHMLNAADPVPTIESRTQFFAGFHQLARPATQTELATQMFAKFLGVNLPPAHQFERRTQCRH